jgi:L-amino acid N-acyltransferase
MIIRKGNKNDLADILEIMNYYIGHTTYTFDLKPKTLEDLINWYDNAGEDFPLYVAEENQKVVGYIYLSPYRSKEAYRRTVELSIYLSPQKIGKGIGKRLMDKILTEAERRNYHVILSFITSENTESIAFHQKYNFTFVGELLEVGYKHNRWVNVSIYQKVLK